MATITEVSKRMIPIGSKFNMLTILGYDTDKKKYKCKCDCGNITYVKGCHITSGHTKSCGCRQKVAGKDNKKHGLYKERIYFEWKNMLYRCYKEKYPYYPYYGGRGIKVCNDWICDIFEFKKWALNNGYKNNLTLDRIDTNGNYCPENCRWVPMKIQMRNTRRNIEVEVNGSLICLADACKILEISIGKLRHIRDKHKLSSQEALRWCLTKTFNKHTKKWEDNNDRERYTK